MVSENFDCNQIIISSTQNTQLHLQNYFGKIKRLCDSYAWIQTNYGFFYHPHFIQLLSLCLGYWAVNKRSDLGDGQHESVK